MPLPYPDAPRVDQIDDYFGTRVADPYRWLEEVDSPQTQRWIAEENALTESVLATVPQREAIRARLTEVWNYERRGVPEQVGGLYAYFRNTGLQNQGVLWVTRDLAEPGRVLLDPNTFSADGTVALSEQRVLRRRLAAGVQRVVVGIRLAGVARARRRDGDRPSRRRALVEVLRRGLEARRQRVLLQPLRRACARQQVQRHQLLSQAVLPPARHAAVDGRAGVRAPRPQGLELRRDHDRGRALPHRRRQPRNRARERDLRQGSQQRRRRRRAAARRRRALRVPRQRRDDVLLSHDEGRAARAHRRDRRARPRAARDRRAVRRCARRRGVLRRPHRRDVPARRARAHRRVRARRAGESEVALPGLGSVAGFTGKRSARETFYSYTSYTEPTSIYRYDVAIGLSTRVFAPQIRFDASAFTSEQVFYTSKDGTRVPMIVTAKKGTPRDGSAPTILYGYGGFDISLTPAFSSAVLVWLEMGGIYAVANLRGGGEYGEAWHQDGIKERKQNVFDDFIAAAEYLIDQSGRRRRSSRSTAAPTAGCSSARA